MRFEPGDKVFLLTDGITKTIASDGSLYGTARLQQVIAAPHDDLHFRINAIIADVESFRDGRDPSDDSCLLGVSRSGRSSIEIQTS